MLIVQYFLREEQGQDLIEYTLLLAFVCLASAMLFVDAGGAVSKIWGTVKTELAGAEAMGS